MKFGPVLLAGLVLVGLGSTVRSDTERSLTDEEKTTQLESRLQAAQESLVLAKAEAEFFQKKWLELRLKSEALGLEALTGEETAMQAKVVRLVGALYKSEQQRQDLEEALQIVMHASKEVLNANQVEKASKRSDYEVAVRQARSVLEGKGVSHARIPNDVHSGEVVDFDEKLGVVILNLGEVQGVKVGMPFRILDKDEVVGRCKVVEVREHLSAAVLGGLEKDKEVKRGNRLILITEN